MNDTLTTAQAAGRLGVTARQIRNLLKAGRLKGQRITPRFWMVDRQSVEVEAAARESRPPVSMANV